jgi:hypothetical protein
MRDIHGARDKAVYQSPSCDPTLRCCCSSGAAAVGVVAGVGTIAAPPTLPGRPTESGHEGRRSARESSLLPLQTFGPILVVHVGRHFTLVPHNQFPSFCGKTREYQKGRRQAPSAVEGALPRCEKVSVSKNSPFSLSVFGVSIIRSFRRSQLPIWRIRSHDCQSDSAQSRRRPNRSSRSVSITDQLHEKPNYIQ